MKHEAKITSEGRITVPAGDLVFASGKGGVHVKAVKRESPFAKYKGIGHPGIHAGRKAIIRYFREIRGG